MRGILRPEPESPAILNFGQNARRFSGRTSDQFKFRSEPATSLNARRFSVRTKFPGEVYRFGCEVFFSQNQNPWRYLPIWMRVVFAARTEIPRKLPVQMRGVFRPELKFLAVVSTLNARRFRSEPKFLAIFTNSNARRFSVRNRSPGGFYQFEFEVFVGRNQNSWRYFPA